MRATTIPQLAQTLQEVLTTQANQLARVKGFVRRESKMNGALFVQTLIFSFLARPHPTWDQMAQTAATLGLQITPPAILQRCTEAAAQFLRAVLEAALATSLNIHAAPVAVPILQRFSEVYLQDSTQITLPTALAALWSGNSGGQAALKLQTRLSYRTGVLHIALCAGRASDKSMPPEQCQYRKGSLRLADLGYFDVSELAVQAAAGAFWLTHVLQGTALYTTDHRRWGLLDLLSHQWTRAGHASGVDLPIALGVEVRLPCRLLARRVPRQVAAELQRRLWAQARDKGEKVSAMQLAMTHWVIFVTNAPAEQLSLAEALILARVRWQIELLFKLWKSHGAIDESHSHKPCVVLCQVYAKLLAMLVQHWTFVVGVWHQPARSLVKAAQVVRDRAMALAMHFAQHTMLCIVLEAIVRSMDTGCRITKRKAVPATYQLLLALAESP